MSFYDSLNYLTDLEKIPNGGRVFVCGDGMLGGYLLDMLAAERADVDVAGIVTTSKSGTFHGLPMITFVEFLAQPVDFEMVIVTPLFWTRDIVETLKPLPADKVWINMVCDCGLHSGYRSGSFDPDVNGSKEIMAMLDGEESREDWRILTEAMRTRNLEAVFKRFWALKTHELHYLEYSGLKLGDVVLEGGVYDGETTKQFALRVGAEGKVFAFDPLGDRYAKETLSTLRDERNSVDIVPCALWDKPADLVFVDDGAATITREVTKEETPEATPATSVDTFVSERALKRVDLIKLDVEGAEPMVLRGALDTMTEFRPSLAISIYHGINQYFEIPLYLRDVLTNYRYNLGYFSPDGLEAVLFARPEEVI